MKTIDKSCFVSQSNLTCCQSPILKPCLPGSQSCISYAYSFFMSYDLKLISNGQKGLLLSFKFLVSKELIYFC